MVKIQGWFLSAERLGAHGRASALDWPRRARDVAASSSRCVAGRDALLASFSHHVAGENLKALIQLQRDLLAIADRNRHGEELRVGLHPGEVVLQLVCM